MAKKDESKDDNWIDALIALGVGALAIYLLSRFLNKPATIQDEETTCPYCGASMKKWSRACPQCHKVLTWSALPAR